MNSKNNYILIIAFCALLGACSAALYMPTQADADRMGIQTDSLMMGRTLYVNHCGACHNLHLPEQYSKEHWLKELPEMQQKAKITKEEARLISNFVLARSKSE